MQRGFKSWCEEQASSWRGQLGLHPYDPLPARKLAVHLEIDVVQPEEIPDLSPKDIDRLLWNNPTGWSALT
ncbi:MAG: hypothetical protein MN733_16455, partial [Nitrososphaera sp.]|nr:hypothetical protein [Nitrososphaera sp.]